MTTATKGKFKRGACVLFNNGATVAIVHIDGKLNDFYKIRVKKVLKGAFVHGGYVSRRHLEGYCKLLGTDLDREMVEAIYL